MKIMLYIYRVIIYHLYDLHFAYVIQQKIRY